MASRMTDASTPPAAESTLVEAPEGTPRVKVLLTIIEGADLDAAMAAVRRQVYEPAPDVLFVGSSSDVPEHAESVGTLEEAISSADSDLDYLWILHSDARPRPDALSALVFEVERGSAALGGSKLLVAGSHDVLESVGSATDVFGEPYSGLDDGEIDLQQYDVVREVSFVGSASMLVRRDLAQGLRGLDRKVPPVSAGLDFSQRARLAGGRVITVPSSEVYHQGRCEGSRPWREQAGRLRAIVTVYSPLTLLWVLPYDFFVSILDSLANLLLLRWRPAVRHFLSWGWNAFHLPSTLARRWRFRKVKTLGDEELFRFQARGSVRLREIGSEITDRVLSLFDDDQALARGSRRIWASPGIWGAILAAMILIFSMRSILFGGLPSAGFTFPFEVGSVALDRWFAGWNESGLGSPDSVHPSLALTGLASVIWFGAEGAARTVLTVVSAFIAVLGMGRLGGRIGLRGPGRYLAGLVLIAGPGTTLLTGEGSWLGLVAAATLPWAVRSGFVHDDERGRSAWTRFAWAILLGLVLAAWSPVLVLVPPTAVLLWLLVGGKDSRPLVALAVLLGLAVSVQFLLSDPSWLIESDRRLGLVVNDYWSVAIAVAFLPLVLSEPTARRFGSVGALLGLVALIVLRLPGFGPGVEEALLIAASFGTAMVVAAGLDRLTGEPRHLMNAIVAGAVLVASVGALSDGRLGLPAGNLNDRLEFAESLADDQGPGRVLVASTERAQIPGEARSGPGYWYRVVDGEGTTHDEVWLPEPRDGDSALDSALRLVTTGSELRPGEFLAEFAIEWVVLLGPEFRLDEVLTAQLDLIPTPLDPDSRVYENPGANPLADAGTNTAWKRVGAGYTGSSGPGRVVLASNRSDGWSPDPEADGWRATVSAAEGEAAYRNEDNLVYAWATLGVLAAALLMLAFGRRRS